DYPIQPLTRRCASSGRELREGERYVSVLSAEGASLVRRDYALDAWKGMVPPEGTIAFWQGKATAGKGPRRPAFDDDLVMDCFTRLEGQDEPGRVRFRYVLALLLMRRRRLRLEDWRGGEEGLAFRCVRTGARHLVTDPDLTEEELSAVQDDVFEALGW